MKNYFGRFLLKNELDDATVNHDEFVKFDGMTKLSSSKMRCNRCGTIHHKIDIRLPIGSFYCPTCINLGRVRSDESLYFLPQQLFPEKSYLCWTGKLTKNQQRISDKLVKSIHEPCQILVQAVTGAGKTEMIYNVIDEVLKLGGTVGIATPRIDVCIELHKRFSRDFSCEIPLLHGAGEPYFRAPLVIATTHQLLRFRQAFDLLIIDEVDAFPFADNDLLYFAAENARKDDSSLIYLTATSTDKLDKLVKSGKLHKIQLARRFHGFPLVLPRFIWYKKFYTELKKQRTTGFPLLIFAPEIELGRQFARDLQMKFPSEQIDFVASNTKNRLEIVEKFRTGKLTILVSTTILERGVTFPKVDVFVIKSAHKNFTKSALIQIAGRAGRSPERPTGLVYFFHDGKTKAMTKAKAEINQLNCIGGFSS